MYSPGSTLVRPADTVAGSRMPFSLVVILLVSGLAAGATTPNLRPGRAAGEGEGSPREVPLRPVDSRRPLSVAVFLNEPYVIRRNDGEGEKYEGFAVDLFREISELAGFEFELVPVRDDGYGSYDRIRQRWTGAIGELHRKEVDVVLGDLLPSTERLTVVDFTVPFMEFDIGALYYRERRGVDLFFFLSPFSVGVWSCVFASLFSFATVLLFFERKETPSSTRGRWSWRLVSWIWRGGVIVLAASYAAALLAVLGVREARRSRPELLTVRDLSSRSGVEYGTLSGGSTSLFFRDSERADYRGMWERMQARGEVIESPKEGAAKVVAYRGNFAFIGETPSLELLACSGPDFRLELLEGTFPRSTSGYSLALAKDSEYLRSIDEAIIELRDTGVIQRLKTKWWSKMYNGNCEDVPPFLGLGLPELGGLFIFLFAALGLAVLFSVFESVLCLKAK